MLSRYGRRAAVRRAALGFGLLLLARPAWAAPRKLLILGDSITAGYGLAQSDSFPVQLQAVLRGAGQDVTVIAAGVSGDTTAGGKSRLDWALADAPDAVIVALGGNDGLRGMPPAESLGNLRDILDRLQARRLPTMLAGMLAPPNLGADYGRDFAATFQTLATAHPEVVFYPFLLEGVAGDPALNQADGIHPNPAGAALMARRMLPAVQQLLSKVQA
jgi:acyl-CoA thioesterase-1